MIRLLGNRFFLIGLVLAVAVAGVVYLRYDVIHKERARKAAEEMRLNIETRKRIDDAISNPLTPSDIIERLRQLAQ